MDYEKLFDDLMYTIEESMFYIGLKDVYKKHSQRSTLFVLSQKIVFIIGSLNLPGLMVGDFIFIFITIGGDKLTNENFLKMVEVTPCMLLSFLCMAKVYRLYTRKERIIQILDELRETWPGYRPMDEATKKVVDKYMISAKNINVLYSVVTHCASLMYNLFPVAIMIYNMATKGETEYFLPYLVWYPYDNAHNFPVWVSSYVSQFHGGIYVTAGVAYADCLFGLMTSHVSMHLELLSNQIQKIPDQSDGYTPVQKLNKAIRRHNKLIRLCELMEELFSPVLLFNLVASSVMICLLLFSITIAPLGLIVKYTVFIASALYQIFIMAWYGNRVIESSINLGFAAYSCPWTTLSDSESLHVKKSLMMMMVRSKRPMCITAYGFTVISMTTFNAILKASWSYFTLLRAVYQKRD